MKKVFMIHGYKGEPNGGWRPWLKEQLEKNGISVELLSMPNPNFPKEKEWVKTIKNSVGNPSQDIFLVGHSLGGSAILRYLESLSLTSKIGGVVLVSSPKRIVIKNLEGLIKWFILRNFFNRPFNFKYVRNICHNFVVIHGDDDKLVPLPQAKEISELLSCPLIVVPRGGHLNDESGWYQLPQALEILLKMINK